MSEVKTVLWKDLKFKYSPNDNYHGTCYYGAMRLLLGNGFEQLFKDIFTRDIIANQSTDLNHVQPFAKYANKSKDYKFLQPDESLHNEEGVLLVGDKDSSHIVYFKDGEYYDDYMSLSYIKDLRPILIIARTRGV